MDTLNREKFVFTMPVGAEFEARFAGQDGPSEAFCRVRYLGDGKFMSAMAPLLIQGVTEGPPTCGGYDNKLPVEKWYFSFSDMKNPHRAVYFYEKPRLSLHTLPPKE